jgi:hypothetical protein
MSSEPKKPMEEMLEALAKARRAEFGDDPKMPNPMRVRLHEEIARRQAAEDETVDSRPSWVTRFWPRLTVAAALATLIVLVPAIWWNQSHRVAGSSDLALRDDVARPTAGFQSLVPADRTLAQAPAVSATEAAVNLADNRQIKIEPLATPAFQAEALTSSTQAAQTGAANASASQMTKGFAEIASAKTQSAPATAPAFGRELKHEPDRIAAAAPPVAQSSDASNLKASRPLSQKQGVQSFRNNAQVSRAAGVLNTFQVQQQGNEIRVLDADGSTYAGKIEQSTKNGKLESRSSARRELAERARTYGVKLSDGTAATVESYFRATGYNVSLKKNLVFEGNYTAPTQIPAMATSRDGEQAEQSHDRARIIGTVRVNGESPVPVDATSETTEPAPTKNSEK